MKKLFTTLFTIVSITGAMHAQVVDMEDVQKKNAAVIKAATDTTRSEDAKKWTFKGMTGLNLSQAAFENWSGGGENSFAINAFFNGGAYYRKGKSAWDNDLSLGYGVIYTKTDDWRKNTDNIDFASKYGYAAAKKLYYTALASFSTQFDKGYNYPNDSIYLSKFMAPGYVTVALGLDYRAFNNFSAFFSPATGKFTFVLDDSLSHVGAYGVDIDKKHKAEIGAYAKFAYSGDIAKNVNLISKLELFTAYDDSFGNIDVNWEVLIGMKINKYLTATLNTVLKYDDDVKYIDSKDIKHGARIQFKELLGIGLSYQF